MSSVIDPNFAPKVSSKDVVTWYSALDPSFQIYGFPWIRRDKAYKRFPKKSKKDIEAICPKINGLAANTAGGQIHFFTNSAKLSIKVVLTSAVDLSQMSRTGQGGFDCYVGTDFRSLKFIDAARFAHGQTEYEFTFFDQLPGEKLVVLNFPLYTGVLECFIGILEHSTIKKAKSFIDARRIVIYGTSITQGGCASRPGLNYTNRLSRMMRREVVNFGFSGNAFGEKVVAQQVAQIKKASLFVLDYEANAGTNGLLEKTLVDFIDTIRMFHPTTPIAVVSRIPYLLDQLIPAYGLKRAKIKQFQMDTVNRYRNQGDSLIYFIDGSILLGEEAHECTTDTIHPNDLGFSHMAIEFKKAFTYIYKDQRRNK